MVWNEVSEEEEEKEGHRRACMESCKRGGGGITYKEEPSLIFVGLAPEGGRDRSTTITTTNFPGGDRGQTSVADRPLRLQPHLLAYACLSRFYWGRKEGSLITGA